MSSLFAQMADLHANLLTAAAAAAAEDAGAARLLELSTAARDLDHALATWRGQAPEASRAALCVADALRQLSEATARFVKEVEHNVETYDDVDGVVEPVRCAVEVCDGSMALGTGKAALLAATHAAREAAVAAQARAFDVAMEMELDELAEMAIALRTAVQLAECCAKPPLDAPRHERFTEATMRLQALTMGGHPGKVRRVPLAPKQFASAQLSGAAAAKHAADTAREKGQRAKFAPGWMVNGLRMRDPISVGAALQSMDAKGLHDNREKIVTMVCSGASRSLPLLQLLLFESQLPHWREAHVYHPQGGTEQGVGQGTAQGTGQGTGQASGRAVLDDAPLWLRSCVELDFEAGVAWLLRYQSDRVLACAGRPTPLEPAQLIVCAAKLGSVRMVRCMLAHPWWEGAAHAVVMPHERSPLGLLAEALQPKRPAAAAAKPPAPKPVAAAKPAWLGAYSVYRPPPSAASIEAAAAEAAAAAAAAAAEAAAAASGERDGERDGERAMGRWLREIEFSDCAVATRCGGFSVQAHRVVLAAGSEVLRTSLRAEWSGGGGGAGAQTPPHLLLPDACGPIEARLLLEWMYTGSTTSSATSSAAPPHDAPEATPPPPHDAATMARLLQAAHALLMPRLVTHCEEALATLVTPELAPEMLSLAELLERPRLFKAAALCVLEHASSSTPPELVDHVLAGLEARTAPQPDSH